MQFDILKKSGCGFAKPHRFFADDFLPALTLAALRDVGLLTLAALPFAPAFAPALRAVVFLVVTRFAAAGFLFAATRGFFFDFALALLAEAERVFPDDLGLLAD